MHIECYEYNLVLVENAQLNMIEGSGSLNSVIQMFVETAKTR
mgnify:CR=1 FL=1